MASSILASDQLRGRFDPLVVARGDLYALRGAVTILEGSADRVSAVVRGTLPYDVSLIYDRRDTSPFLLVACTCAHASREPCKHAWAVLRVAERHGHLGDARGHDQLALGSLLSAADERRGPELRWVIDLGTSTQQQEPLIDVFERTTSALGFSTGFRKVPSPPKRYERGLFPSGTPADIATLARTGRCDVRVGKDVSTEPLVVDEGPPFRVVLVVEDGGPVESGLPSLVVHGELRREGQRIALEALTAIFRAGLAFLGGRALRVESDVPFRWTSALQREGELQIAAEESLAFLRELLRKARRPSYELPASIVVEERASLRTWVRVHSPATNGRAAARKLEADVVFDYGGARVSLGDRGVLAAELSRRRIVVRDSDAEQRAIAELLAVGFERVRDRHEGRMLKIATSRLSAAILALPAERFVVEADGVVHRRASRKALSIDSGVDWFDLAAAVEFDGVAISTPALLEAAKRGDGRVRLGDGTVGVLPERWLARVARVMDLAAAGDATAQGTTSLRFRRSQLTLVDAMLGEESDGVAWDGPLGALRAELATCASLPMGEAPRGFRGDLREYQRAGLAWMQWLEGIGFSGCLADDMGLGKTVQVLALLADRKERGRGGGPSLIVAPRSVVFNWLDEARRFAPGLEARELTPAPESDAPPADLLVTTYGVLRRHPELLARRSFDYLVLDEAHAIKNGSSSTTRAVRMLAARHRLALTGTPVENHLGELASLFDFLNPGMMGPSVRKTARQGFDLDPEVAARLGRGLRPFVLRRKKSDVLTELPPRIDQALVCTMPSEQRAVYDRVKRHYQAHLLRSRRDPGHEASPLAVLEALLRLRQIACHPGLVDPALRTQRSGKLDVLVQHLEPLARDGKKAIVFSQFTSLLDLVGRDLSARGIAFARLDGSTSDRQTVVAQFQTDPACPVFLVSLKAGGVGLNLTAAEYVFLLDPWWNPAAEAQAVDRAHRFGQQRTVVAYRLLCKDSIEERVAELQEKKRALVASVFSETEGLRLGALSAADVEALLS